MRPAGDAFRQRANDMQIASGASIARAVPFVALLAMTLATMFASACGVTDAASPGDADSLDVASISSPEGTLYVLAGTTNQRSELVTIVDLTCDTVQTRVTERASVTLWSDGRALRESASRTTRNGAVVAESRIENRGTWYTYVDSPYDYYDEAPGIVLLLESRPGERYEMRLRRSGATDFSLRQNMGGSRCGPSTVSAKNDPPRVEEWFYTRR